MVSARLNDLRERRIEEMNAAGIDIAVLSHTIGGVKGCPTGGRDEHRAAGQRVPGRRSRRQPWPVRRLRHHRSGQDAVYRGHPELVGATWGFAPETATHMLRIVYGGMFDRHPDAKLIIGHLGEMLPFFAWRIQRAFEYNPYSKRTRKRLQDYLSDNIWVTTSGNFSDQALVTTLLTVGSDHIMFASDYPYEMATAAARWIETTPISENDRRKNLLRQRRSALRPAQVSSLLRLDASIRVEGSNSRAIADIVEQEWRKNHPSASVIHRQLGINPIPSTAWAAAVFASRTPEDSRTDEQRAALALAATLTDELAATDALLFAVPLYNFGVSQHFKMWVDLVITDPRMASGAPPVLAGKPAVLVTVRGGNYRPGTPREGWDHTRGWMRRILADVWRLHLKVVEGEFTLVGVNPALDQFKDLARQLRQEAEDQARRYGRELGATAMTPS